MMNIIRICDMASVGSLLSDYLEENKISQTEFAEMYNMSKKHVNEILSGKTGISLDTFILLSLITGDDIDMLIFFNEHKKIEDEFNRKFKSEKEIKEYLKSLNIYDMAKNNWFKIRHKEDYATTLIDFHKFCRTNNFDNYINYARKNYLYKEMGEKDLIKVALWIAHCNNLIEGLEVPRYDSKKLNDLFKELEVERCKDYNEERLIELFNKYGIILVIEEPLKGTKVRGVTHVKINTPVIYMNTYYKNTSSFYFALYHELGHVKKHYNMLKSKTVVHSDEIEDEVDAFALDKMIPDNVYSLLIDHPDDEINICKKNNIPLSFYYSRLAYEGRLSYKSKKYLDSLVKLDLLK